MKTIQKLQSNVSVIEQTAINHLINVTVINLGLDTKTPIVIEGYKTGGYIEVDNEGLVWILQNPGTANCLLKELPLTQIIKLLNSLSPTVPV